MSEPTEENLAIEPTSFSRAEAAQKQPFFVLSPVKTTIIGVFLLLATVAFFMFNAKAIRFYFDPITQTTNVTGSWPTYLLGNRFLMLPGEYEITASQQGYEPFMETVSVGSDAEQEFQFFLTKLPGIIEVLAVDDAGPVSGANVSIDQIPQGSTPLIINEVVAGSRDLYIDHLRYLPYQAEIQVEGKRIKQLEQVQLSPAWAEVMISSLPASAQILIDDEIVGQTPQTLEVLQGTHALKLQRSGYKIWETELDITAQQDAEISDIVLIKSDGKLNITSHPSATYVTISGQYYGQTPLSIALAPNDHYELLATKAGFDTYRRTFAIKQEQDQSFNLKLNPVVGIVRLTVSPASSTLFVDGAEKGGANQTLELTARAHALRIELPGYATFQTEIIPQPGLPQQLNISMQTEEEARVSEIPQRITTASGDILRFIIPGNLEMGAGRRERGSRSNEVQKQVELTRAYYLGEQEISNESFKAFNPGHDSGLLGRALLNEDDRPVVNISWEQAARYCNWLSDQDGLNAAYEQKDGQWRLKVPTNTGYRLPTEAEWAWAARYAKGEKPTRFPWGDTMPPSSGAGNFADISAISMVPQNIRDYNDNFRGPAPSGTFNANEFGIFDLAGNVSEWVSDYYSIEILRETLIDPIGPAAGDYYVIRGSNYTHGRFSELRWTFRDYGAEPRPDVGFRIARYLE